jgi:hypothetical protein
MKCDLCGKKEMSACDLFCECEKLKDEKNKSKVKSKEKVLEKI